ncbi:winged helix-turn-helix domain-containing protein [Saccharopolyspora hirsuta]|uniref:Winged helix-turn-helix transcriptional regulator n=1 Tax=Saccharopolyspora hirsuta TaxID=1837 RepID=A0A5M7BAT3_SACHI|nr:winged helix-turn-helix domain-containing protein [Saccharopolyspora hirsuta]KAA5826733.1 winged helix-turn-helix transcriptional regulator [Saccharopolyspora hirsuta]
MDSEDLQQRLEALEQRVAALEGAQRAEPAEPSGSVVQYQGNLVEPVELEWRIQVDPARVLDMPDGPRTDVLAALGHPARAAIVRLLAQSGPQHTAALQEAAGLSSTGQLYHHLKSLTGCGLVEQDKRGTYRLRAQATIPALILLTAASDIAGQLRP